MATPTKKREPLAALLSSAINAQGLTNTKAAKLCGISTQKMSDLLNRQKPYGNRPPSAAMLGKLERLPGVTRKAIVEAMAESIGMPELLDNTPASPLRRLVYGMVEKIPEDRLARTMRLLTDAFEDVFE